MAQTSAAPAVSAAGLSVRYGVTTALTDVSIDVNEGELVVVLGTNGAGKTTLLNAIMGIVPSTAGRIRLDGADITRRSTEWIVNNGMTISLEGRRLFGQLTVYENLRLGAGLRGRHDLRERYEEVVELFPLLERKRNEFAGLLSGGEQQQLAIARALMSRPRVLLLDEPSLGLAPILVGAVFELIAGLREQGITMVLVEQNVARALEIADRGYVLSGGRIELAGTAAELRASDTIADVYLGSGEAAS